MCTQTQYRIKTHGSESRGRTRNYCELFTQMKGSNRMLAKTNC